MTNKFERDNLERYERYKGSLKRLKERIFKFKELTEEIDDLDLEASIYFLEKDFLTILEEEKIKDSRIYFLNKEILNLELKKQTLENEIIEKKNELLSIKKELERREND